MERILSTETIIIELLLTVTVAAIAVQQLTARVPFSRMERHCANGLIRFGQQNYR